MTKRLTVVGLFFFLILGNAFGREKRVNQIPNGAKFSCTNCHTGMGGPRNAFGQTIQNGYLTAANSNGNVIWGADLAALDSDGDGFANGTELQDSSGAWAIGNPAPGALSLVANPGSSTSKPVTALQDRTWSAAPAGICLLQNYPNPFNGSTRIRMNAKAGGRLKILIFSMEGVRVWETEAQPDASGSVEIIWNGINSDGLDCPAGAFLLMARSSNETVVRKMVMTK